MKKDMPLEGLRWSRDSGSALCDTSQNSRSRTGWGDFRFIIIHRVYYPESSDNRQQNLLMSIYALISKIGIDEPKALGLDTSMVVVERVPLIINHPVIKDKVIKVIKDSETSQS